MNNANTPGFFRVFCYLVLFALLGVLTAVYVAVGNFETWIAMAVAWGIVLVMAVLLQLLAVRKRWVSALETAWLALLALCWLLVLMDTVICGFSDASFCEPVVVDVGGVQSGVSYSMLVFTIPIAGLCFPWGLPIFFGWVQWLPYLFETAGFAFPGNFSLIGRFFLMLPMLLAAPLGYWLYFSFVPRAIGEILAALRVGWFKSRSKSIFRSTWSSLRATAVRSYQWLKEKYQTLRRKKEEEGEEKQDAVPAGTKKPTAKPATKSTAKRPVRAAK